jgi:hypothetical protein
MRHVRERGPRSVDVCTLLDRPVRRIVPLDVRYVGQQIDDVFVLGYGLHFADLYRNLPFVVTADRRRIIEEPAAYVQALYGGEADDLRRSVRGGRMVD